MIIYKGCLTINIKVVDRTDVEKSEVQTKLPRTVGIPGPARNVAANHHHRDNYHCDNCHRDNCHRDNCHLRDNCHRDVNHNLDDDLDYIYENSFLISDRIECSVYVPGGVKVAKSFSWKLELDSKFPLTTTTTTITTNTITKPNL